MPFRAYLPLLIVLCLRHAALAAPPPQRLLVATFPDLCAVAREVAGDRYAVRALLSGAQDPLSQVPQPDQALLLSRADVLLALGGDLEAGWLPDLLVAAHNQRLGEHLLVGRLLQDAAGSPYPLSAPPQAIRLAQALAEQLALSDPPGAAGYRERAAAFSREVEHRQRGWQMQLAPLRGQKVVTGDDSFRAFIIWAGLTEIATLSPGASGAPGAPGAGDPSAATHVLHVLRAMREGGGRLILQREYEPAQVARVLAERAFAQVVVVPLGARVERGERYVDGVDQLVHALVAAYHRRGHGEAP